MKPPLIDLGGEWPLAGIDPTDFPEHINVDEKAWFIAEHALNMAIRDAELDMLSNCFV